MAHVLATNPYVNEAVLTLEYLNISRDPQLVDLHLAGLRSAQVFPAVNVGEHK
jgi:hypothetical protein